MIFGYEGKPKLGKIEADQSCQPMSRKEIRRLWLKR